MLGWNSAYTNANFSWDQIYPISSLFVVYGPHLSWELLLSSSLCLILPLRHKHARWLDYVLQE
jgi:hypothetical protein